MDCGVGLVRYLVVFTGPCYELWLLPLRPTGNSVRPLIKAGHRDLLPSLSLHPPSSILFPLSSFLTFFQLHNPLNTTSHHLHLPRQNTFLRFSSLHQLKAVDSVESSDFTSYWRQHKDFCVIVSYLST